jgi:hypothetical protein
VQRVTNSTLNVKYRAECASQDYKKEVEVINDYLSQMSTHYKPILKKIQDCEHQRIEYLKLNVEKFIKNMFTFGTQLLEKSSEFSNSISMVNSDTDIRIFIDENKSDIKCPLKVEYRPYEHSLEILQQK